MFTPWRNSTSLPLLIGMMLAAGCGSTHPFGRGPSDTGDDDVTSGGEQTPSATETPSSGDDDVTTGGGSPTPTEPPISFTNEVKPLLVRCTVCHSSGTGGFTYDGGSNAYNQAMTQVNVNDPPNSLMLIKMSGGQGHGGGTIYPTSSEEYQTVLGWIEDGAPDN